MIQGEIQRRMEVAQKADPVRQWRESLRRELTRIQTGAERLLTAYQEGLSTLEQLRRRMPELRKQQQAIQSELTAMELAGADQSRYLQLTHTLAEFRDRLRVKAETMEMAERQRILRLLVKEILVDVETITIRHSIPLPNPGSPPSGPHQNSNSSSVSETIPSDSNYLLRSGSHYPALGNAFRPGRFQNHLEQMHDRIIADPPRHFL